MAKDPDLERAYALDGPEANRALYADWAETYDDSFAKKMGYRSPTVVARAYATLGLHGPVLDIGAGTGLVGEALIAHGPFDIDATDLSDDMLAVAERKGIYRRVFTGDLTASLDVMDRHYTGVISAGTFTHGHVGPEALHEVMRILKPGGATVITVSERHWESQGFDKVLSDLGGTLAEHFTDGFDFYGPEATGPHAKDRGILLTLFRA